MRHWAPFRSSGIFSISHGKPTFGTWPCWSGIWRRRSGPRAPIARSCCSSSVAFLLWLSGCSRWDRCSRSGCSARWTSREPQGALLVADCASKRAVESSLAVGEPRPLVGEVVRLTLSYNTNAAMGFQVGGDSRRLVLSAMTIAALCVLGILYHRTRPSERLRVIGVALVAGGALGNLVDRLRSSAGVVDFIDVGVANVRFWTFNLADMGITIGAVMLLLALGRWGQRDRGLSRP